MERYLKISTVNIRHNLLAHMLAGTLLALAAPAFMGIENLNQQQVAKIMEVYLSLIGIILFVPTYIPDMDGNIYDLIRSKKESMIILHVIRVAEAFMFTVIIGLAFLYLLKKGNCEFSLIKMFYTFMSNSIFLGGLGMFIFSIFNQLPLAYMIPLVYYIVNYGSDYKHLGNFYLFSMQAYPLADKKYLFISGIVFIVSSILIAKGKTLK